MSSVANSAKIPFQSALFSAAKRRMSSGFSMFFAFFTVSMRAVLLKPNKSLRAAVNFASMAAPLDLKNSTLLIFLKKVLRSYLFSSKIRAISPNLLSWINRPKVSNTFFGYSFLLYASALGRKRSNCSIYFLICFGTFSETIISFVAANTSRSMILASVKAISYNKGSISVSKPIRNLMLIVFDQSFLSKVFLRSKA